MSSFKYNFFRHPTGKFAPCEIERSLEFPIPLIIFVMFDVSDLFFAFFSVIHKARSEKCLICLSSGRWMLHKSYLDACLRESRWVDETPYEWGGPGTEPLLMQLSPAISTRGGLQQQHQKQQATQIRELARSARRWRIVGGGAFKNWRVIFGPGCDKETSFRRVIESGGGQVGKTECPFFSFIFMYVLALPILLLINF